jgi:drug/metabolite transporter (DMT)-like permease
MNSNYIKGSIFILLSALAFSMNEVLGTFGFRTGATTITILTVRSFVATILFGLTMLIWNKKLFKVNKSDIKWLLIPSLVLVGEMLAYWEGLRLVKQVSVLVAIIYTAPLWTTLYFIIFKKKKFTWMVFASIFIAIVGVLLAVGLIPNFSIPWSPLGLGLFVLASFCWSTLFISSQKILKTYHPFTLLFYMFAMLFVWCLFLQRPDFTVSQLNPETLKYLITMGIVTTYLSYMFLQMAIKYNLAVKTQILDLVNMPITLFLVWIFLGQTINWWMAAGIVLIMVNFYILGKTDA